MVKERKQVLGKVVKTYPKKCGNSKLCKPTAFFEMLEQCKECKTIK